MRTLGSTDQPERPGGRLWHQFPFGQIHHPTRFRSVLNQVVALLAKLPAWELTVEGHTDNVGARAANVALSRQRSEAVIAWLVAHGVDKARLSARGLGDSKPVTVNAMEENRAKNVGLNS
jgi:outer membrane protein OmpA-like peptidoglycan-associated protein